MGKGHLKCLRNPSGGRVRTWEGGQPWKASEVTTTQVQTRRQTAQTARTGAHGGQVEGAPGRREQQDGLAGHLAPGIHTENVDDGGLAAK